jgi:TfoX/Sxy family transcriptional regulator of competence genes
MANASRESLVELEKAIDGAAKSLGKVTAKRMFGCHALFANDSVFGLVWKEGRIGVRLPDETAFKKLMSLTGSAPWKAGKMTMSHWVLVPVGMHKEQAKLSSWLQTAHGLALLTSPKPKKAKATKAKTTKPKSPSRKK